MGGKLYEPFGIKICDLENSVVVLFKEQSHKGRVIVAAKDHVGDMAYLTDEQRAGFFGDMAKVANVIHELFNPDKINYAAFGDTGGHAHFHLVPKYEDGFEWGSVFEMNPAKVYLTDAEYTEIIELIKNKLI
jgi:diadenosine tetraphosphate (Ap4A) HIT family hydrolase